MPIALERDHRRRLLTVRLTGVLTLREALDLLRTATADPAVETWPLIFDARGATTDMTPEDVESAVATVAEIHRTSTVPRGHVAIIADDDQLYVRMLLYETCLSDIGIRSVRAFRQPEAAERWLDIMHAARNF